MIWQWSESAGALSYNGAVIAHGYSGAGLGKNNPAMAAAVALGPIPTGTWNIAGVENGGPTGPFTLILNPAPGTDTHGRSAFRIHGDSIADPGTASHGCVVVARPVRERIWASGDHTLEVTA